MTGHTEQHEAGEPRLRQSLWQKFACNICYGEKVKPWMTPCSKCKGAGHYFAKMQEPTA